MNTDDMEQLKRHVRALLKFSFAEPDHRIQSLETDVGVLKARLDRLDTQQRQSLLIDIVHWAWPFPPTFRN